jgi:ADP-dependent phosphofructokinase/glucokinase
MEYDYQNAEWTHKHELKTIHMHIFGIFYICTSKNGASKCKQNHTQNMQFGLMSI